MQRRHAPELPQVAIWFVQVCLWFDSGSDQPHQQHALHQGDGPVEVPHAGVAAEAAVKGSVGPNPA